MQQIYDYVNQNKSRFIDELKEFLRFQSVSTDPAFKKEVDACSHFVKALLTQR